MEGAQRHLVFPDDGLRAMMQRPPSLLPALAAGRGTVRRSRTVEGSSFRRDLNDMTYNRLQVAQNIHDRYPHRPDPLQTDRVVARNVPLRARTAIMRLAVNLDRKARFSAEEVENVKAQRVLATELQAARPGPQHAPQQHFGQAHRAAKFARFRDRVGSSFQDCPSTTLRMVPLPAKMAGRICGVESPRPSILPAISRGRGPSAQPAVVGHCQ